MHLLWTPHRSTWSTRLLLGVVASGLVLAACGRGGSEVTARRSVRSSSVPARRLVPVDRPVRHVRAGHVATAPPMAADSDAVTIATDESVVLAGGYRKTADGLVPTGSVRRWTRGEQRWTELPSLPQWFNANFGFDAEGTLVVVGTPCPHEPVLDLGSEGPCDSDQVLTLAHGADAWETHVIPPWRGIVGIFTGVAGLVDGRTVALVPQSTYRVGAVLFDVASGRFTHLGIPVADPELSITLGACVTERTVFFSSSPEDTLGRPLAEQWVWRLDGGRWQVIGDMPFDETGDRPGEFCNPHLYALAGPKGAIIEDPRGGAPVRTPPIGTIDLPTGSNAALADGRVVLAAVDGSGFESLEVGDRGAGVGEVVQADDVAYLIGRNLAGVVVTAIEVER